MDAPLTASDFDRPAPPPESPVPEHVDDTSDRVVLGVAGFVADSLGVDTLWVRMAFVVLALVGGIGILAYLAIWLIVFGPERTGLPFVRYIGGAAVVVGIPLVIAGADLDFASGPIAVVALLLGLMLALWQPRQVRTVAPRSFPPPRRRNVPERLEAAAHPAHPAHPARPARQARAVRRPRRQRRQPSILGRLTFGLAVIVAAVGALIDLVNGGRLHPEQWLGAAALICGIGLLVGAVRGRAWWLILPALVFAGAGYVTGLMARIGMDAGDAFGDTSFHVDESTPGGPHTLSQVIGDLWISIDGVPERPVTIDARAAIGSLEMSVNDAVSVEIRSASDRGDLTVNGVVVPDGLGHLGPDGPPDVIIDARFGIGDVRAFSYDYDSRYEDDSNSGVQPLLGDGPFDDRVLDHADGVQVDDGVGVATGGWIVLAYGEGLIAPDNSIVVGALADRGEEFSVISTGMGDFVVEGRTLQTPFGVMYDLDDLRREFSAELGAVGPSTTIVPDATGLTVPSSAETAPTAIPPSTTLSPPRTTTGG